MHEPQPTPDAPLAPCDAAFLRALRRERWVRRLLAVVNIKALILGAVIIIELVTVGLFGWAFYYRIYTVEKHGQRTQATVVSVKELKPGAPNNEYSMTYTFDLSGKQREHCDTITAHDARTLRPGQQFEISYLYHKDRYRISSVYHRNDFILYVKIGLLLVFFLPWLIIGSLWYFRRRIWRGSRRRAVRAKLELVYEFLDNGGRLEDLTRLQDHFHAKGYMRDASYPFMEYKESSPVMWLHQMITLAQPHFPLAALERWMLEQAPLTDYDAYLAHFKLAFNFLYPPRAKAAAPESESLYVVPPGWEQSIAFVRPLHIRLGLTEKDDENYYPQEDAWYFDLRGLQTQPYHCSTEAKEIFDHLLGLRSKIWFPSTLKKLWSLDQLIVPEDDWPKDVPAYVDHEGTIQYIGLVREDKAIDYVIQLCTLLGTHWRRTESITGVLQTREEEGRPSRHVLVHYEPGVKLVVEKVPEPPAEPRLDWPLPPAPAPQPSQQEQRKPRPRWFQYFPMDTAYLNTLGPLAFICGLIGFGALRRYETLNQLFWLKSFFYLLPFSLILGHISSHFFIMNYRFLKKKWERINHGMGMALLFNFMCTICLMPFLVIINSALDKAPSTIHRALVVEKLKPDQGFRYLVVDSWRPSKEQESLHVSREIYDQVTQGQSYLLVETKPGRLGQEWIVSVELENEPETLE